MRLLSLTLFLGVAFATIPHPASSQPEKPTGVSEVRFSNGQVISNVPDDTTIGELKRRVLLSGLVTEEEVKKPFDLREPEREGTTIFDDSLPNLGISPTQRGGTYLPSAPRYYIEVASNDELFIINGERFEAKTYCFNMQEGDPVIFLEGSAYGACASAEILNLRTNDRCGLWCE